MKVETLRAGDNFIHVLIAGERAAVVDPGAAGPVRAFLDAEGLTLELILITHYHGDHTGGVAALRQVAMCRVAGPPGGPVAVDPCVSEGNVIEFVGASIEVMAVPGHTAGDVAYYVPAAKAVFTGDTLFAAGCGRVFGGAAQTMWYSLCRLRELPDDTRVFGGHDYTLENLEFAAHLEPGHAGVRERLDRFRRDPAAALPSTLAEEERTNPFLRCDEAALAEAVNLPGHDAAAVFAAVRGMKNRW